LDKGLVFSLVGSVGVLCSVLIAYIGILHRRRKESFDAGAHGGSLKADLRYIKIRVDDLLKEQKDTNKDLLDLIERVTRLEEGGKDVLRRIDRLEEKQ
jgi:hypothetical protein